MKYIPGDLYIMKGIHEGKPVEVDCIIVETDGESIRKLKAYNKEPWLLKHGFFEEGEEYVVWWMPMYWN